MTAIAVPAVLHGQEESKDIGILYNKSVQEMNAQNWEEALKITEKIIEDFGEFGYEDFGAMFGGIHYNRGICLIRLRDYAKAAESFQKCAEEFPNEKPKEKKTAPDSINPYEKTAVFQWALCKQLEGEYAEAIKLYERFIALNPPAEELQPGAYFINLGICQANVGQLDEAIASVERVFTSKDAWNVQPSSLLQGFVQLGSAWVKLAPSNPAVLDLAHGFMDKYLGQLHVSPYDMQRFNPLVVKLAQEAVEARQFSLAVRFYSLYASVPDAIEDLLLRSVDYGGITAKLQEEIDRLQAEIDGGDSLDVNVLRGLAAAYEGLGNHRASYIIHQHLEKHYENSKYRPEILFQATRGAAAVGDTPGTLEYGSEFLEKFGDHELFNDISNLLVGALFERREYKQCVDLALKVREALPADSKARDLVEFVLGASYYYLGDYEKAQPVLDAHAQMFPESQYAVNSLYFQASNMQKLQKYAESGKLFDAYIEKFPASPLLDIALFERAMSDFVVQDENFDLSLGLLDRIAKEFPGSNVLANGMLVKGDILRTKEDLPGAQEAYLKAKESAQSQGNEDVAGEALSRLVDTSVAQEKWEDGAKYYDEFFEKYGESSYKLQVAVVGLESLRRLERVKEGLGRLEKLIVALSNEENQDGMERAVNSYTTISSEEEGVDETIAKLTDFPGLADASKNLKAWLLISKIGLLQEQLKAMPSDAPDHGKKSEMVQAAFNELKDYDKAVLGNYILVQLGRYIVNTGNPFEAVPFFEEILSRDNKEFEDYALLELAKIWGRSRDVAVQKQAIDAFKRIIEVFKTEDLMEEALIGLGDLAVSNEDWNTGLDIFQKYQQNKSFKRQRPKANFMIARCYEGQGDITRAQKAYVGVFAVFTGHLEWSAQAHLRNADLEWNKGTDVAKRNAYEMLRDLERIMGVHANTEGDVGGWVDKALRRLNEMRDALGITPEMERLEEEAKAKGATTANQ